jgi:hypothetical protein
MPWSALWIIGPSVSPSGRPREPLHFPMGLRSLLGAAIIGGLIGEWTDAESRAMLDQVVLSIGHDAKSLPRNLRGPLALILADRLQRQGKPDAATPLFCTARDDAESGSALRRLAESALANRQIDG